MRSNHACTRLQRNEQERQDFVEEKQNELLPPNISWPGVLEGKLTPSEDTTGKWVASTTSFERKGLRFGMESSPASAEVKGSRQAEEREDRERAERSQKESMQNKVSHVPEKHKTLRRQLLTCPRCGHWKPRWAWLHGGLESWLQVKEVALHLHCTAGRGNTQKANLSPLHKQPPTLRHTKNLCVCRHTNLML